MVNKYRVHEVAKDMGVSSNEILDLLKKYFQDTERKHMTALTEQELDVVFEHYTRARQVASLDDMKSKKEEGASPKTELPEKPKKTDGEGEKEPVAAPPSVEKLAQKETAAAITEKTPITVPAAEEQKGQELDTTRVEEEDIKVTNNDQNSKEQEKKTDSVEKPTVSTSAQGKPVQAGTDAPKPQNSQNAQARQSFQGNHPQGQGQNRDGNRQNFQGNRPQSQGQNRDGNRQNFQGNRPQGQGQNRDGSRQNFQGNRPQGQGQNRDGSRQSFQGNRPQGQFSPFNRPKAAAPRPQTNRPQRTVSTVDDSGVVHVDMRAAHVDLDKYNERYEQIAPTTVKDNGVKKQKFTQRSAQKKPFKSRGEQEAEKLRRLEMERQRRQRLEIALPDEISVGELASRLKVQAAEIIKKLMMNGVMASVSDVIDYDTAALVAMEIGAKVEHEVVVTIEDRLIDTSEDDTDALAPRCPVVVVMGHVDHGKTSLLDAIRHANVTSTEAGGITQHIGAYQVTVNDRPITFLDTPGHAAFTSMRARGAQVTDIAILVVAADDGIMPQTVEAINHAKAAGVSIIVAINKMDKPAANAEKVKQELTEYELVPEEWGGDVICVPVSAKTHENIDTLLEMVQLVADMNDLKANPSRLAKGTVIEARLDKGRGPVATLLVQNGTLHSGDIIIAGTSVGRVRVMLDDKGNRIESAGPSTPVEITGLAEVPSAGDIFNAVEDERLARELVEERKHEAKEEAFKSYQKVTLDNLFSQIAEGEILELPVIIKADVQGSVEAVKQSLEKLSNEEIRVRVIHGAVGAVSESDVMLASASNAIIVGFNVRPDPVARDNAERDGVDIRLYRIIYDAIEEIQSAMKGMLAPKTREVDLGRAEIRQVYKITNVGIVAGCYVTEGKIVRSAKIRVVRDGIIIADDQLDSLKRFKDDVREVASGYECGMSLVKFNDIKEGDVFEAYTVEEYQE